MSEQNMADPDWARVERLARHRQLEKMKPGYWLRAELVYQCECPLWDPTATGEDRDASLCELRGSSRLSITAQQARSCRLPEK